MSLLLDVSYASRCQLQGTSILQLECCSHTYTYGTLTHYCTTEESIVDQGPRTKDRGRIKTLSHQMKSEDRIQANSTSDCNTAMIGSSKWYNYKHWWGSSKWYNYVVIPFRRSRGFHYNQTGISHKRILAFIQLFCYVKGKEQECWSQWENALARVRSSGCTYSWNMWRSKVRATIWEI